MKTKRLFLIGLVLAIAGTAYAADILKVQNVEVAPGESVALRIELDNETTNLMGWQCDIVLPEGLSLALKNNGKPIAVLGERFATTEHSISSSRLANGTYRFIATSMDGEAIPGISGTLFTVTLVGEESLEASPTAGRRQSLEASPTTGQRQSLEASPTTLTGTVTNVEFNTQDNQKLAFADVAFTVTIPGGVETKCATPTIAYDKGELVFSCETEGVQFVSEVKGSDAKTSEDARVKLDSSYTVTVYATKDGYDNSDVATATIQWRDGRPLFTGFNSVTVDENAALDVNGDGKVDVADIAAIIKEMAK